MTGPRNIIVDRREWMVGAGALGLVLGASSVRAAGADRPNRGGTFRLGMAGGSASDSLDPRTISDSIPVSLGYQIWNGLIEVGEDGAAKGELLESWEPNAAATEWIFNLRRGVTFHSGKTLDADDIVYSINLHRGDTKSAAKDLLVDVVAVEKLTPNQIRIRLRSANVDLPYNLTDYHILGVPDGFTNWAKPDGTGAYALESYEPGVRVLTKATGHYWKPDRGWFDSVETRYIVDVNARTQALLGGEIDAANRLDPKTVDRVGRSPKATVVRTAGTGNRYAFVALCDSDPYRSNDARLALKFGIDRQKIISTVYNGYATTGNDTTMAPSSKYYAPDVPPHVYDPDKAASLWRKAGSPAFALKVSEGAFAGATDAALLFQDALKAAGIPLDLQRVSGDGYWTNVWLKAPFCAVYWAAKPTADLQLSQTFTSGAVWNDTHWRDPGFDKLIAAARVETDEARRRQMYADAQHMVSDTGGMVCFAVGDYLDGYSRRVRGVLPSPRYDMSDQRVAEKAWFA